MKLTRLNPTAVFLATLALVLVALFTPGVVGGLLMLALAGGLIYLMTRSWPVQTPANRAIRLVILTLLIAGALTKIM
ncbi:hypothetical protein [Phytohabitans aurantiacus]|jgi:hypothetical protein|uniref:Uncharacterized protein n=1 Tax=Phytohabitans aurantiacus TaxID=3016789 RepID=A0ABQ5R4J7_9ACTN|nr:hypothetical protein [Phytohabitans aurantiacus]GLI01714.1 hypothetical protein Pa4123_69900 [Phytohabitans aurantiacus]